ncbi:MAG TPA: TadE family protein [Pyrinomonadaceae bacterium]|nr:TadE family protein [Pyrinomonadaceae bacterium]
MTRLRNAIKNFIRRENGTQMIEFALILPALILLFAGTVELGRLFYQYTTLAKATRAGARYLSTVPNVAASTAAAKRVVLCGDPNTCGDANHPIIVPNLNANKIVVTPPAAGAQPRYVTVEITNYNYEFLVFNLNTLTGGTFDIPLTPRTRMRYMVN